MMMNLIIPPISDCFMPTLGVAQIAGYLKKHHIPCRVFDANAEVLNIIFRLREKQPVRMQKLLGDGTYTYQNVTSCINWYSLTHNGFEMTMDSFKTDFQWQEMDKMLEYIEHEREFSSELRKLSVIKEENIGDCYGISISYECQVIPSMLLIKVIRQCNPKARICVGGALLYNYENNFYQLMYQTDLIDILIVGSGEEALECIAKDDMQQLSAYKGIKVKSVAHKYIIDTRELETRCIEYEPDFSDINFTYYPTGEKAFPYMIKDKCYYGKCKFCNGDEVEKQSLAKDVKLAFENMQAIAENTGIDNVYIVDAALSPRDFHMIAQLPFHVGIHWIANTRFDKGLREEILISRLADKGCTMLRFGLESASQRVLDLMNKGTRTIDAEYILKLTARYGIKNHVYIMFGYPGETAEDRKMTIDFLERNKEVIESYSVSLFNPIPGTPVYLELTEKVGEGPDTYDNMLNLIYPDEKYYAEICDDVSRLNKVLRGYVRTNTEYYSANIFNQSTDKDRQNSVKNLLIKEDELQDVFGQQIVMENHVWIYEKRCPAQAQHEKYVIVDLFNRQLIHLLVTVDVMKNYLMDNGEKKENALELDKLLNYFLNNLQTDKDREEIQYFDIYTDERELNQEICIQFFPENKICKEE